MSREVDLIDVANQFVTVVQGGGITVRVGAAAINSILANVIAEEIAHSRASVIQEQIVALKQPSPSPYAARLSPQVQQASAILRLGERVKLQNLQL